MGGTGSGNWYRWNTKTTTEQAKRIDIRYMRKQGLLAPNRAGTLSWKVGGEPNGDINYSCLYDHLRLSYRYREHGGEWQPIKQHIPFDRTPCHYGGERLWFLCPRCNTRIGILYCAATLFLCRHCCQLPYASQQEGRINNIISQKHKIGERIFKYYEYGEGWGKKKGIHWTTYHRQHTHFQKLEQELDQKTKLI
jgi:hypothetical protein